MSLADLINSGHLPVEKCVEIINGQAPITGSDSGSRQLPYCANCHVNGVENLKHVLDALVKNREKGIVVVEGESNSDVQSVFGSAGNGALIVNQGAVKFDGGALSRDYDATWKAGGEFKFSIKQVTPLTPNLTPEALYLLKAWQIYGQDGTTQTWFQTHGKHPFQSATSIASITGIHPNVDGQRLIDQVSWEEGASEGPTLFTVSGISKVCETDASVGVVWDWAVAHTQQPTPGTVHEAFKLNAGKSLYHIRFLNPPPPPPPPVVSAIPTPAVTAVPLPAPPGLPVPGLAVYGAGADQKSENKSEKKCEGRGLPTGLTWPGARSSPASTTGQAGNAGHAVKDQVGLFGAVNGSANLGSGVQSSGLEASSSVTAFAGDDAQSEGSSIDGGGDGSRRDAPGHTSTAQSTGSVWGPYSQQQNASVKPTTHPAAPPGLSVGQNAVQNQSPPQRANQKDAYKQGGTVEHGVESAQNYSVGNYNTAPAQSAPPGLMPVNQPRGLWSYGSSSATDSHTPGGNYSAAASQLPSSSTSQVTAQGGASTGPPGLFFGQTNANEASAGHGNSTTVVRRPQNASQPGMTPDMPPGLLSPSNSSSSNAPATQNGNYTAPGVHSTSQALTPDMPPGLLPATAPNNVGDDAASTIGAGEEVSDSESECLVPFDPESYGLQALDCSEMICTAAVSAMLGLIERMLYDIVQSFRFMVLGDPAGFLSQRHMFEALKVALPDALMQRGNAICLVPQRMFKTVQQAVWGLKTSGEFHGGVLMHLLQGLEEIHRTKQISLQTCMVMDAPSNPFAHMDGATLGMRLTTMMPGVNRAANPIHLPIPYTAQLGMPDMDNIGDSEIKHLFRNAPFLLQKQMNMPKFMSKMKDYIGQRPAGPLRRYQQECVDRVDKGENYIFVAPTGAGKTKIFVECSRQLLEKNPLSTIIVICPTVPLATQQACVYVVEGFLQEKYWVNAFSSENQLKAEIWSYLIRSHNVMIMTAQILLNVMAFFERTQPMEQGNAMFYDIDMLILDECHHVRKEHPYNKIMRQYKATPDSKMQVLGFTASPAKSTTLEDCQQEFESLLENMNARCIVIGEENVEVQKYVPSAREKTVYTEPRREDAIFAKSIGRYLMKACTRYISPLIGSVRGVMKLPENCMVDMAKGVNSSFFENWTKTTSDNIEKNFDLSLYERTDILACCELLRSCNNSLDLLKDAGFESALRYLSKKCNDLSQKFNGQIDFYNWNYPKLLAGLYCTQWIQNAALVLQAFRMAPSEDHIERFPRFVELVKFLEGYSQHDTFHGIVFVKTRDGVYHLASMLRNLPQLRFLTPIEFIGHGRTTRKNNGKVGLLDGDAANDAMRGMTGNKQREILEHFSSPGRHVMVATSAAEEGINVTTCEFVVRYSVTETGIQRVQSRGRTRVQGGLFLNIIERESKEGQLFEKSIAEEQTMNMVLKIAPGVEHI